jgi:tripartite-type tricarboxylate transporter receptor subunit TctC
MKRQKSFQFLGMLSMMTFIMVAAWDTPGTWAAEIKYPTRPIQIIIGYEPGSTDMGLKPFTERLQEYIGQPVSYVYKPGAAGTIGASFVAKAKPDGYTLLGTSQTPVILSPLTKDLDYKLDDFVPVSRASKSSLVLAVKADSPWKTVKDIVDEAKKSPGKLTYSSAAVFGSNHLVMEEFVKLAGINMTHVPCKGSAPAVTAALGGHVNMVSSTMAPLSPHLKSGALRPIGVFEKERIKEFPAVPTFSEAGYPVIHVVWYGFFAPKGTPDEVVKTISTAIQKVVKDHHQFVEDRLGKISLNPAFLKYDEFAREVKDYNEEMKRIIKELMKSIK